jgi:hypothetical protein
VIAAVDKLVDNPIGGQRSAVDRSRRQFEMRSRPDHDSPRRFDARQALFPNAPFGQPVAHFTLDRGSIEWTNPARCHILFSDGHQRAQLGEAALPPFERVDRFTQHVFWAGKSAQRELGVYPLLQVGGKGVIHEVCLTGELTPAYHQRADAVKVDRFLGARPR